MSQVHRVGDRAVVVLEGTILALGARAPTSELLDLIDSGNAREITPGSYLRFAPRLFRDRRSHHHSQPAREDQRLAQATNASDYVVKLFGFMRLNTHCGINALS
jgi:hypothetical protein